MLIDSGTPSTLRKNPTPFFPSFKEIRFYVLTHIDFDHIGGFLKTLTKLEKNDLHPSAVFYANTLDLIKYKSDENVGFHHGSLLIELMSNLNINTRPLHAGDRVEINDLSMTVLSPNEEHLQLLRDKWEIAEQEYNKRNYGNGFVSTSRKKFRIEFNEFIFDSEKKPENDILNVSSIALLIEHKNIKILMLGDAHSSVISEQLKLILEDRKVGKLKVDIIKISHHGSKHNTSYKLLNLVKCNKFIISTDGSAPYNHPDQETISKIIISTKKNGFTEVYFYFNYQKASEFEISNESELDIKVYKIVTQEVNL
ncbi:DNA internalization-related competence protein ComEC/Rec2 [Serratia fonticola]|uniref:DNA internalization-related competence protein ComEC/Rec2 n=1 Tax=Serratia fonticola TaxID=47917 RepID=A0A448S607_SERFO|nr:DNA internalization-related competence protein ComEC/Rec2 [Serratia fonticola]